MKAKARRGPRRYDYTKGSILRGITRLSVPAFGEQFTYNIETIVEVYWVGQLGSDHLAALSIAYMFLLFSRMVGFGIRVAGQALVAQQIGGEDGEKASLMAGQTIV
ncbi:MAG: MATE family efflux transporter, partial [Nitrospinota bacterium]|nr:MATE family efflux transporter [Nitrospinota bacterium]